MKLKMMIAVKGNKTTMLIIALMTWFALSLQFYVLVSGTPGNGLTPLKAIGRFFIFFTIISNLLVAGSLTMLLVKPRSAAGRFFAKPSVITAIAVYMFIVGLVYNLILRSIWHPEGLQKIADELFHVAVPLLFIGYWLLYAPKNSLEWIHAFRWLIFPALYLVYAMTRGAIEGFYPYPFLNANELPFGRVFMNSTGLLILFILTGILFVAISKKMSPGNNRPGLSK